MRKKLLQILGILLSGALHAQENGYDWGKAWPNIYSLPRSVRMTQAGDIWIGGSGAAPYPFDIDWDPGAGEYFLESQGFSPVGDFPADAFTVALRGDGNFKKAWLYSNVTLSRVGAVAPLEGNGVITMGNSEGCSINFGLGGQDFYLCSGSSLTYSKPYLLKQDTLGNPIWGHAFQVQEPTTIQSSGQVYRGLQIDNQGNILMSGSFYGKVDFNPGLDTAFLYSQIDMGFIAKFASNGEFLWAIPVANSGNSYVITLVLAENEIVVGGVYDNPLQVTTASGVRNFENRGGQDIFILRLSPNGVIQDAKTFGGPGTDGISSISTEPGNRTTLVGFFETSLSADDGLILEAPTPDNMDIFALRLNGGGTLEWVKRIGGTGDEGARMVRATDKTYYLAGFYTNDVDFDPGDGEAVLEVSGSAGSFFAHYDSLFNFIGAARLEGTGISTITSLYKLPNQKLVITGAFTDSLDLDPGLEEDWVHSNDELDYTGMFVCKVNDPVFHFPTHTKSPVVPGKLEIVPNPASVRHVGIKGTTGSQISVYNTLGQVVRRFTMSRSEEVFSMEEMPSGVYLFMSDGRQQRLIYNQGE